MPDIESIVGNTNVVPSSSVASSGSAAGINHETHRLKAGVTDIANRLHDLLSWQAAQEVFNAVTLRITHEMMPILQKRLKEAQTEN